MRTGKAQGQKAARADRQFDWHEETETGSNVQALRAAGPESGDPLAWFEIDWEYEGKCRELERHLKPPVRGAGARIYGKHRKVNRSEGPGPAGVQPMDAF